MIYATDLHLKNNSGFFQAQQKFLNYLNKMYSEEILVLGGDIFDVVYPHWYVYRFFVSFLENRNNRTYINVGNHEFSKVRKSPLLGLATIENVCVIFNESEIEIEGMNCLFLPHQYNMKHYENLEGEYSKIFCHFTPEKFSFGKEYINIDKLKGDKIYGHIHDRFIDKEKQLYLSGVHYPTRKGETSNPIFRITKENGIEDIQVPEFLRIEEIDFNIPLLPENKDNLYIINNCPNKQLAEDKFRDYYIYDINFKVKNKEDYEEDNVDNDFNKMNTKQKFDFFSKEQNYNQDIRNYIFEKMDRVGI